jgi:hypothetical protein
VGDESLDRHEKRLGADLGLIEAAPGEDVEEGLPVEDVEEGLVEAAPGDAVDEEPVVQPIRLTRTAVPRRNVTTVGAAMQTEH